MARKCYRGSPECYWAEAIVNGSLREHDGKQLLGVRRLLRVRRPETRL